MVGEPFLCLQSPPASPVVHLLLLCDVGGSHRYIADLSAWLSSTNRTHSLHVSLLIGLLGAREEKMRHLSAPPRATHPAVLEGDASSVLAAAENVVDGVVYAFGKHDPTNVDARLTAHSVNIGAGAAYLAPDLLVKLTGVPGAQTQPRTTWQRHLAQQLGAESDQRGSTIRNRKIAVIEVDAGPQNSWPSPSQVASELVNPENLTTVLKICIPGSNRTANKIAGDDHVSEINPGNFHEGYFTIVKLRRVNKSAAPWEVAEVHYRELPSL